MEAQLVVDAKALLGEGPHWDEREQQLYWVDIIGKQLHVYKENTGIGKTYSFEQMVSSVVPAIDGGLLITLQDGIYLFDPESETLCLVASVEPELTRNRLNDAKCDPTGRLWAGTMSMDDEREKGSLYVLEPSGLLRAAASNISCSNGLAWNEALSRMYYIDTPTGCVDSFEWDKESGHISNRRTVVRFPESVGMPDGMTIDEEGMLWVAHWGGSCVSRWNPETGKQIGEVTVPALYVTSCTFGGPAMDELYITTARLSAGEQEDYPLAGGLFVVRAGVRGMTGSRFGSLLT